MFGKNQTKSDLLKIYLNGNLLLNLKLLASSRGSNPFPPTCNPKLFSYGHIAPLFLLEKQTI